MKKILLLFAIMLLSACGSMQDHVAGTGRITISFYTDPTTKVQYILYHSHYGAAITPRLNPDGTLYIKED